MATTFNSDDAKACFRCNSQLPAFRLISLEHFPNASKQLGACLSNHVMQANGA